MSEHNLLPIAGDYYYFDLERISEYIRIDDDNEDLSDILSPTTTDDGVDNSLSGLFNAKDTQLLDVTKWEMTKAMVETILSDQNIVDEKMGYRNMGSQLTIPFKLSFNTLLVNKIIKKV